MRLILIASALVSAVLPLFAGASGALACSCAPIPSDEAGIRAVLESPDWRNAIIAIGTAETSSQTNGSGRATVSIERVYRGSIGGRVELRAEGLGGSCDYIPAAGSREFLVINARDGGAYSASLCGSRSLDPAVDPGAAAFERTLNAVSAGAPPGPAPGGEVEPPDTGVDATEDAGGDTWRWVVAGGALATIIVTGGVLLAARRGAVAAN